jgi:hypothetical protein
MTDLEPEATPAPEVPAPEPAARNPLSLFAVGLAVVFGVTTVLLAIVAVGLKNDKDRVDAGHRDVEAAAGTFVQALVDYRYDDPASLHDDVVALSADPFTEQFEAGVPQIQALNTSLGRVSQATVKDVFVASVEDDQATAIVVYDAVETFTGQDPVPYQNVYVRLGLVKLDGAWKVNDVINLNLALDQGSSTSTTATSAPPG